MFTNLALSDKACRQNGCPSERDEWRSLYCKEHRSRHWQHKRKKAKYQSLGQCGICGRKDLEPGYLNCGVCRKKSRSRNHIYRSGFDYSIHKAKRCNRCGFIPEDECQLSVDHKDENRYNNERKNLETLCQNCHALKTKKNKIGRLSGERYGI